MHHIKKEYTVACVKDFSPQRAGICILVVFYVVI
nr:MAG TPA: hypothetical protein [Caudoviricetes sp.]DAU10139.1 MAG TPA: hypothetical protein [Caudoviricetes sp.]